ncbi:MAG TPA: amino acid adenylation domain-containing protein [Acidobacteriaceae bacterium]|jgi:amino acid adenylation domain-containing protein|nr:amino acid adenylation domain-containing protein [Acidobacteriaceae bacterium]
MRDAQTNTMHNDPGSFVNANELLAYLRQLDVDLTVDGDRLACSAPRGILTPHLQQELKSRKAEILAILQQDGPSAGDSGSALCVPELIERQADRTPDAVAVVCGTDRLTYRELSTRSSHLANRLRSMGIGPEVIAGVCLERSVDMLVALLAVQKAGGAYLPLDPEFPPERLAFMLEDSGAAVLISRRDLLGALSPGRAAVLHLDNDSPGDEPENPPSLPNHTRPNNLAYVIYTSGSTGKPKGVAIEQRSLVNLLQSMRTTLNLTAGDHLLAVTTLSFDIAGLELYLPLLVGARLTIAPRTAVVDGIALSRMLRDSEVTIMQATPVTWRLLLDAGWDGSPRLKMLCGGEALSRELANRLLATGGELWNLYGPTETTIWSTACRLQAEHGPVPIGKPIANTQVYVLDDQQRPVPPGVAGEIYIGGIGVARGYLNRSEETAARFLPDPFRAGNRVYRTGDLVRHWADGNLEYLGRNDQQVKLRGFRIELGEIESALEKQPGVRQAVVLLREDQPGDQRLTAYVAASTPLDPVSLRNAVAARLPQYMVPSAVIFLDAFPLTPNKKVDRKALPAPNAPPPAVPVPSAGSSDFEDKLTAIWKNLLKVQTIDPHENFFSLGGHSLLIVQMQSAIRQQLAIEVSIPDLFQRSTIAELAQLLDSSRAPHPAAAVGAQPGSSLSPHAAESGETGETTIEYLDGGNARIEAEALFADAAAHHSYGRPGSCLVIAQPKGTRRPLFMVAGFQGPDDTLLVLSRIVPHMGADQPVYGFRPRWVWGGPLYANVQEEATEYLAALRTVQPRGPYLLAGYCLSGLVAFEMARQLIDAGEKVGLLALIDTERPSAARTLFANTWHGWERLQHMASVAWDLFRRDNPSRSSDAREVIRRKLHLSAASRIVTPHEAFYSTRMSYQRIVREYVPQRYPGRLTLIVNEFLYRSSDRYRGWRGFPAHEMVIHKVSGDHITMFKEHGHELAHLLLESSDSGAQGPFPHTDLAAAGAL